jgi:hypothetical protein
VFKPSYHLPLISKVKCYIEANQHLPGMPSEKDVAKDGINVGEMNALLVKKVDIKRFFKKCDACRVVKNDCYS